MSQIASKPVRVQCMRSDEHDWDNYAPAVLKDVRGGLDANGHIVALELTAWEPPGRARPSTRNGRFSGSQSAPSSRADTRS
jgi:hypothetical protein